MIVKMRADVDVANQVATGWATDFILVATSFENCQQKHFYRIITNFHSFLDIFQHSTKFHWIRESQHTWITLKSTAN